MPLVENERVEEAFLIAGDKLSAVSRAWWIALAAAVILAIPAYFVVRSSLATVFLAGYDGPRVIYNAKAKEPLQILEKKIFSFPNNAYAGYIKIRNVNLEWGVSDQTYTAEFKTLGGTEVTKVAGSVFILPASEKLIVFTRFTADQAPQEMVVSLGESHFIHRPDISVDLETQRTNIKNNSDGLIVTSAVRNTSAFTVKRINLPVAIYDNKNQIIAVNYTYINDVISGETRSFQYSWPISIPGAVRAEINPEVNIFDPNVLTTQAGTSPFTDQ